MKLLFVVFVLYSSLAYAEDLIFVKYEEVKDCPYPSARICKEDDNGVSHCVIKQDERCQND